MRSGAFYNIIGLGTPIYTCSIYMGNVRRIYYNTRCFCALQKRSGKTDTILLLFYCVRMYYTQFAFHVKQLK